MSDKFRKFIGIDVSKAHIHVCLMDDERKVLAACNIKNEADAVTKGISTLLEKHQITIEEVFCCIESTGKYDRRASNAIYEMGIALGVEPYWQIQSNLHVRNKNDQTDAERIADFARASYTTIRRWKPRSKSALALLELLSIREALSDERRGYIVRLAEIEATVGYSPTGIKLIRRRIKGLKADLEELEREIAQLIKADKRFYRIYKLLLSIPGIGKVNAWMLLAVTDGFARFATPRQLAAYSGVAPYEFRSGSSIRKRSKVSHRSNKQLKSLLHMAAVSITTRGKETDLRRFYERKLKEGKHKMSALNMVRNKLIHLIFAVIKRGTPYQTIHPNNTTAA